MEPALAVWTPGAGIAVWGAMQPIIERLGQIFSAEKLAQWISKLIPNLIAAVLVFLAYYLLWKLLARVFGAVMRRSQLDKTAQSFIESLLRYVMLTIALVSSLAQVGINTGSILASLGVAGLTLGFAAKDVLSHLISGLFIFWDRPFVIGDLVEIGGQYGRVDKITMRSTRVVTVDGKMLAIPNANIVNSVVTSYTNFPHLRLDIPMTVGLGEDYNRVGAVLLEVVKDHPQSMADPAPKVVLKSVGDYNVEVELQVWIDDEKQHIPVRHELRRRAYEALRAAKIDMPYETVQLAPFEVTQRALGEAPGA